MAGGEVDSSKTMGRQVEENSLESGAKREGSSGRT